MVYKIGITGGMASGKSKCLQFLSTLDKPRIYTMNLDLFAGKIYALNPQALRNVEKIFGSSSVTYRRFNDTSFPASVDRVGLGNKVFESAHNLNVLKSITSPEIKKLMFEHFKWVERQGKHDLIAVEGAILIEALTYKFFDELWVVTLPKEEAVKRIIERDAHLNESSAMDRLSR